MMVPHMNREDEQVFLVSLRYSQIDCRCNFIGHPSALCLTLSIGCSILVVGHWQTSK